MDISNVIKSNRANISDNSIKTYTSILKNVFKKYADEGDEFNNKFFENEDHLISKLKDVKPNIRKTIYASLIAITPDKYNKKYKSAMMADAQEYKNENLKQNKTEAQNKQWLEQNEIKDKIETMKKQVKSLWNKKDLTADEYKQLQDYILICLTSGYYFPPRRSLDWVDFVIKSPDETKDNYLKGSNLVFNHYKGSTQKGQQIISLSKNPFLTILKKFIKINPHKYLLVDSNNNPMNSVKINQHLKKIFGGKGGINILRHSFISDKYPIFNVEQLKKDAEQMGSSSNMMLDTYIKKP